MKFKNIPRIYIDKELKENIVFEISIQDKHYLCNVMRLKEEDRFKVFNGVDGEWVASISSRKQSMVRCISKIREQETFEGPSLYFSIIKNNNLKWMIEKVTELGIKKLIPVITERTIVKSINRRKLLAHIKEASEVSDRISLPQLEEKMTLQNVLKKIKKEKKQLIFCNENRNDQSLFKYFSKNFKKNISFLIGPEGGFSMTEQNFLKEHKSIISVKLNDRILRADTAAILAISAYNCYNNI
tara:strand:+ start:1155 stop:1880 length:726 start_codon:yes stop_codon:yes gene_type:complete